MSEQSTFNHPPMIEEQPEQEVDADEASELKKQPPSQVWFGRSAMGNTLIDPEVLAKRQHLALEHKQYLDQKKLREEKIIHKYQLTPTELHQIPFEQLQNRVENFLNTPHIQFCLENELSEVSPILVREILRGLLLDLVRNGNQKESVAFLKSLILQDSADGSNMPEIFRQREADLILDPDTNDQGKIHPFASDGEFEEQGEDILNGFSSAGFYDNDGNTLTTYKSHYYAAIIEALQTLGSPAEEAIINCLRDMHSIFLVPDEKSLMESENAAERNEFRAVENRRLKVGTDISLDSAKTLWERDKRVEAARKEKNQPSIWGDKYRVSQEFYHPTSQESLVKDISAGYIGVDRFSRRWDEYQFEHATSAAINTLTNFPTISPETTRYFVNELIYQDEDTFMQLFTEVMGILNKAPELSSQLLLSKIQTETDPVFKAIFTRALYQLELGKINMSTDGAQYLGKVFDLNEANNPDYFAHRATGDGKIAIFDEHKRAVGYFQLSNLDSLDRVISSELFQFTYDTLFHAKPDETPAERAEREAVLEEFKEKYFDTYITNFFEETGVRFNNLSFPEQGWFLWFIQNASIEDRQRAKEFIATYREPGFRAFLSLEQNNNSGRDILMLGENVSPAIAKIIFDKYGKIVDTADATAHYVATTLLTKPEEQVAVATRVTQTLLQRGQELLSRYAQSPNITEATVAQELSRLKQDVLLFNETFKTARQTNPDLQLEDVAGMAIESKSTTELTADDQQAMLAIAKENWQTKGSVGEAVLQEFLHTLQTVDQPPVASTFHLLKHQGRILSFMRFDQSAEQPDRRHAASFNVRAENQYAGIGEAMRQTVLAREAQKFILEAEADPTDSIGMKYVEEDAFIITDAVIKPDDHYLLIECDRTKNNTYRTKSMPVDELLKLADNTQPTIEVLSFNPVSEAKIILTTIHTQAQQGFIVTRYFSHPDGSGRRVYVFEQVEQLEQVDQNRAA